MSPRGRRPGGVATKAAIVDAARVEVADAGYEATSLRAIARRAEVDPALVHHYFGGKPALFAAVMDIPVDPATLIARIVQGPREDVGEAVVRTFLAVWDSPDGRQRFQALIRSAVNHDEAARMLREFLVREVFGRVVGSLSHDGEDTGALELRAGMAASQMVGVAMLRYVVEFPAVVAASHDQLTELVAPTMQRYLAP